MEQRVGLAYYIGNSKKLLTLFGRKQDLFHSEGFYIRNEKGEQIILHDIKSWRIVEFRPLKPLFERAENIVQEVYEAIKTLTVNDPLTVFNGDDFEGDADEIWDLPYGYYIGKYETYNEGRIKEVQGENVKLFLMGERHGEAWEQQLYEVPFQSQLEILEMLIEREHNIIEGR